MKIAIFHHCLDAIGGAERVVLTLARELPADVYSTNIDAEKIRQMGFRGLSLNSIGKIPDHAPLRQQMALSKFRSLDLADRYDLYIIAGDWAVSALVNHKPNLIYIHSPVRQLWDLYEFARFRMSFWKRPLFDGWVAYNRWMIKKYMAHAQKIVCNSSNTRARVKKYFDKDAVVINPPVDVERFKYQCSGDYWLSVNRLVEYKRVEIQLRAFQALPDEKLVIVGNFGRSGHFKRYVDFLYKIKPPNVAILDSLDLPRLTGLYGNCKGFITTSKDEDFGLTAIEAMASGKPVIAPNEGGYKETVINGVTGILIDDMDAEKLIRAVKQMGAGLEKYKEPCVFHAKSFDTASFIMKMKDLLAQMPRKEVL